MRKIEPIKLRKEFLEVSVRIQYGLPLQIIQKEHPSADRNMLPSGQTLLHLPHLLHLSSSNFR